MLSTGEHHWSVHMVLTMAQQLMQIEYQMLLSQVNNPNEYTCAQLQRDINHQSSS